ncbi:MAG: cytochrome c1 [Alphaproteobacteria bacterium]
MNATTTPDRGHHMRKTAYLLAGLLGAFASATFALSAPHALAAEAGPALKEVHWSFEGPLGSYDKAALQRGFQVYKEVCASCHSLQFVTFGNLDDRGGPGFSEPEAKAIAKSYTKEVLDETGQPKEVPRTLADTFPAPYPNEETARAANNGALPPDLSLMPKARAHGPNYIFSLLTGFQDPPPGVTVLSGMHYNPYFPAPHQLAMAPPLTPDRVVYADGTPATVEQMAKDVVTFLHWTAEPKMEERKRLGISVMIYLILLAIILYAAKRHVWRDVH